MVKHEMFSVCESKQPLGVRLASLWAICFYGRLVSHTHTCIFHHFFGCSAAESETAPRKSSTSIVFSHTQYLIKFL